MMPTRLGTFLLLVIFITACSTVHEPRPPSATNTPDPSIYHVRKARELVAQGQPQSIAEQLEALGFRQASKSLEEEWRQDADNLETGQVWVREAINGGRIVEAVDDQKHGHRVLMVGTRSRAGDWKRIWCASAPDVEQDASLTLKDFDDHLKVILDGKVPPELMGDHKFFRLQPMMCWGK